MSQNVSALAIAECSQGILLSSVVSPRSVPQIAPLNDMQQVTLIVLGDERAGNMLCLVDENRFFEGWRIPNVVEISCCNQ